jgi:NADH-quinone oxidoreductase subunit N
MEITFQASDLWGILPALILIAFASVAALMEVFARPDQSRGFIAGFGVIGSLVALAVSMWQWTGIEGAYQVPLFGKMLVMDAFSTFFNGIFAVGALLACLLGGRYLREHKADFGEYTALILFGAAGMGLMVQSRDLVVMFVNLEIMSIAIYVLSGFVRRSRRGAESALKYFLMGSVASAVLLYGVALLYGMTGSTDLVAMREAFDADTALATSLLVKVGMVFLLGGLAFKVALAPFHLWTPDVYDGAPSPVTAFMAAGVKAAGFAVMVRVFTVTFGFDALEFGTDGKGWVGLFYALAVATMFAGNLAAIPQVNVKRMLAYSSIAHAGYLLVGIITGAFGDLGNATSAATAVGGNSAVLYYLLTYAFSTFLVLAAISLFGKDGEEFVHISDFAGFGFKRPFVALALTLGLLSLAGIPPLGGFFAKFYLFREAMALQKPEMVWLTLLAIVNSMIALYYYLRVIVFLYMKEPTREVPAFESKGAVAVMVIALAAVLVLGLFPDGYVEMARRSVESLALK